MLESSGYSQRVISPFGEESGEEELTVLPRHTKVVVTGNNRTKSVLVGLRGVVKKAVGLGGWHWLVLTNGDEVKLQRNALSVIEAPAADEDEEDHNSENFSSSGSDLASGEITRHLKPRSHKLSGSDSGGTIRSRVVNSSHFTGSKSSHRGTLTVNLRKLETAALWRYSRHFHLTEVNLDPSKEQLVKAVERHFVSKQLDEFQVIAGFVHAAKRLKHSVHGLPG